MAAVEPAEAEGTTEVAVIEPKELPATAFTKVEKSLASLGFFTPSSRRIKDQRVKRMGFTREIDGKKVEVTAEILPTIYGLPITADQDKYLALQNIITDIIQSEGKLTNPIRFTSAQLLRLLNKRVRTGKNYKEIVEWLDVMSSTTIISNGVVFIAGQKRFARDRFHVFERAVSVGKELEDGTIADANYVWLSPWQLENINHNFLLPIDFETYRKLKNHIAKALVPLLQIWLFASHKAGSFEKRYDELCEILSLQNYKAPSLITRQFKPSLDELVAHGYLEQWRIEKTTDNKAYKIILFHGPKFHRDRRKRLEQKGHVEAPVVIAQSQPIEPNLPEPGKLDLTPAPNPKQAATAGERKAKEKTSAVPVPQVDEPATEKPQVQQEPVPAPPAPSQPAMPGQAEQHTEEGETTPNVLDELVARGLMASAAMKLLSALDPERLDRVADYIEYWDSVNATGGNVRAGFLYDLIKKGAPLPNGFETSRQRAERKAKEDRHNLLIMAKQALDFAYEEQCRDTVDRFIAEQFPKDELERRVEAKKRELGAQQSLWGNRPDINDQMARHAVRAELAKQVPLISFEDFARREAPKLLADYGVAPSDLGITAPMPAPDPEPAA